MAGEAKTNNFMLSTATVMIGAQSDLFNLNEAEHSIGLVKNYQMQSSPQFTDLRQGRTNSLVYSLMTENTVNASCEVYEYTETNLAYALGLNGASLTPLTASSTLASAVDGTSSPATTFDVQTGEGSNFADDQWILIDAGADQVTARQIDSISTDTITVKNGINVAIPAGATVKAVNPLNVGQKNLNNYFSAKVVGRLANDQPIAALFPKVKLTGGINLQFQTNDYGNLPFEMAIYDLVASDPFYSSFKDRQALLLKG